MQYEFLLWLRLVLPKKRYMPSWKSSGSLLFIRKEKPIGFQCNDHGSTSHWGVARQGRWMHCRCYAARLRWERRKVILLTCKENCNAIVLQGDGFMAMDATIQIRFDRRFVRGMTWVKQKSAKSCRAAVSGYRSMLREMTWFCIRLMKFTAMCTFAVFAHAVEIWIYTCRSRVRAWSKTKRAARQLPIRKHREERENGIASAVPFSHFSIDAVTFDISKAPIPL